MYVPRTVGEYVAVSYYGSSRPAFIARVEAFIPAGATPDKELMDKLFNHRRQSTKRKVYAPINASKNDRVVLVTKTGAAYSFTLSDTVLAGSYFAFSHVDEYGNPLGIRWNSNL